MLSIAQEKKHGYAILKDVKALSAGKIRLSNGTLYGALTRLQDQGLISRVASDEPQDSGRPRKAYQLTDDGLQLLNAEIARLEDLVETARLSLAGERI
jgi:DNA-binding PadR family transcriptional regulator